MIDPLLIIDNLRHSDPYIESIFTQGSCFRFYLFLKAVYPDAICLINWKKDHVVTKIGDKLYDIHGIVKDEEKGNYSLLTPSDEDMCRQWSFATNYFLQISECPYCEEPLLH